MFIEVEEGRVMVVFNLLNENVASDGVKYQILEPTLALAFS